MQQQDHTEKIDNQDTPQQTPATDEAQVVGPNVQPQRDGFDWPALFVALGIAAFFAVIARFNSQPSPSFVPIAVLSATGCGLLVTALRKVRHKTGIGLREAGLAGFGMAIFQFAVALTYPAILTLVKTVPVLGPGFLVTWLLVGVFAALLSVAGAAIGHLAFAPMRSLPAKTTGQSSTEDDDENDDNQEELSDQSNALDESVESETTQAEQENTEFEDEEEAEPITVATTPEKPQRLLANYSITVLLLGLLPMMAGYVFAAAYDFLMNAINVNQVFQGLYPTLSLIGGLLPWRSTLQMLNTNAPFTIFTLLWRIPDSMTVNPNLFDVQSLEPLLFNAVALTFLLLTMYGSDHQQGKRQAAPWGVFLLLQAFFGLVLVLPANIWLLRGLEGVLQIGNLATQLPTTQVLTPTFFVLNLLTGVIFCLLISLIVRRQYQLWTAPRANAIEEEEAE